MSHEQSMFCNDHYINIIVFMLTFIQVILDLNQIYYWIFQCNEFAWLKYVIFYTHAKRLDHLLNCGLNTFLFIQYKFNKDYHILSFIWWHWKLLESRRIISNLYLKRMHAIRWICYSVIPKEKGKPPNHHQYNSYTSLISNHVSW